MELSSLSTLGNDRVGFDEGLGHLLKAAKGNTSVVDVAEAAGRFFTERQGQDWVARPDKNEQSKIKKLVETLDKRRKKVRDHGLSILVQRELDKIKTVTDRELLDGKQVQQTGKASDTDDVWELGVRTFDDLIAQADRFKEFPSLYLRDIGPITVEQLIIIERTFGKTNTFGLPPVIVRNFDDLTEIINIGDNLFRNALVGMDLREFNELITADNIDLIRQEFNKLGYFMVKAHDFESLEQIALNMSGMVYHLEVGGEVAEEWRLYPKIFSDFSILETFVIDGYSGVAIPKRKFPQHLDHIILRNCHKSDQIASYLRNTKFKGEITIIK